MTDPAAENASGARDRAAIAYLTSQYPATSHTFISREVAALREIGVRIETFSIRPPSDAELRSDEMRREAQSTYTVLRQPFTAFLSAHLSALVRPAAYARTFSLALRHRPPGLRGLGLAIAHFAEAVLLAGELRRRGITRLHNHFANSAATVGYLATRLLNLPWSFTMHGISETDYPAGLLLGRKIEAADFVACVSYFGRAQAMRLVAPDQWQKLEIVRCGLPLAQLPAREARGDGKSLIAVGRLSPEKGHAGLLQAFATIAAELSDARLILIGDGPESGSLRALAQTLGISERVEFAGRLGERETIEQIAGADILVLSSFMEGLPIVLMEAMAVGTPVIASRVAGIPELVAEGESGLLFTPSNWEELGACIQRLMSDELLRDRFARKGKQAVAAEFDSARSAGQMRDLFLTSSV